MLPVSLSMFPRISISISLFLQTFRPKLRMLSTPVLFLGLLGIPALCQPAHKKELPRAARNLPLGFEENRGQAEGPFRYLLRYNGSEALFSRDSVDFRAVAPNLEGGSIRLRLIGSDAALEAAGPLEGRSNYLIGADASKWIRGIPNFRQIEYTHLYPGISLAFYGNGDALEHDFRVEPGADFSRISLRFDGADGLSISAAGDLEVRAAGQKLTLHKPVTYQNTANGRASVDSEFVLRRDNSIGFRVGDYDKARELIIDPVLSFATYLSPLSGEANLIATDASGDSYVAGYATFGFPTTPARLRDAQRARQIQLSPTSAN